MMSSPVSLPLSGNLKDYDLKHSFSSVGELSVILKESYYPIPL